MKGWLFGINVNCSFLEEKEGKVENFGEGILYTNLGNKFENDRIKFFPDYFLEGFITNKDELMDTYNEKNWEKCFTNLVKKEKSPIDLRGSFCGFQKKNGQYQFFSDHLGSKAIFYYCNNGQLIVSTRLIWISQILQANNIMYTFNSKAAQYMLTYGFMIDDSTFIKEVKRILPGNTIVIGENGKIEIEQYYRFTINRIKSMSEDVALELIDSTFRKAIKREFDKDKEYGYKHLVDLSGGLDSRMVSWVAHDMGYDKQVNFSYCKAGYLDHTISSEIAKDLKHEYYFKQLDDFQWIYSIDTILQLNNGEALYSGITGGQDCLSNFNDELYGIEHTGMLGDIIISSFALNKESAYEKPVFGKNQYSKKLTYELERDILEQYENQEIFDLYTRGILGAMSTYAIRQNYFEVSSPFLDVDFMEACFSVPMEYRVQHNIYLKWIDKYYKAATNYGWEKWAGVKPRKELEILKKCKIIKRELRRLIRKSMGKSIDDNMNPVDFWFQQDLEAQAFYEKYFNSYINSWHLETKLKEDMEKMFSDGTVSEKAQVMTVLGMVKLYF